MLPTIGSLRPWTDPSVLHLGRQALHVPLPLDDADSRSLDGTWSFALFDSPDAVPASTVAAGGGTDTTWRPIDVPGNWTMQDTGDLPHYTNIQMPFDGPPPSLPERNPTGVYRTSFSIDQRWLSRRTTVVIGGAESVHAVYLNGSFVGYGTDSRLPSSYEITDLLAEQNELAVVVVRYSAQSYVEDQDQWWMAGLHRSVRLESRPPVSIVDVVTHADYDPASAMGSLQLRTTIDFAGHPGSGFRIRARLRDPSGAMLGEESEASVDHVHARPYAFRRFGADTTWRDLAVEPWSAESPRLYVVTIELIDADDVVVDSTRQRVGFRRVAVRNRQLLVNGEAIWIFGVNRHDHHPDRGKAVTASDMRADLELMRAHNINAIRTSHYPNDDAFYDLCDELGFYVFDEANIEAHAYNRSLCDDPAYRPTWLERGARMVQRDRNHPSVIVWSLGNESGYGANHDALAGWIRRADPTRPLHYEDAIRLEGWVDGGRAATDLVCPMYPEIADIEAYGADGAGDRPLIMCEYSHAMGNSNGSLADYWDVITATPGLQGGFLWEWKDHGLRQPLEDGATRLAYGGQFGDTPHDANFVADGLMSADLEPHPSMREVTWVHRPVVTTLEGTDRLAVTNRRSFAPLDDLTATWELLTSAGVVDRGSLTVPTIARGESAVVALPVDNVPDDGAWLTVGWRTVADAWFAPAGHLVAWDQLELSADSLADAPPVPLDEGAGWRPRPSLRPVLYLWRAATDNDGFKLMPELSQRLGVGGQSLKRWLEIGLDRTPADELVDHELSSTVDGTASVHRHVVVIPPELDDLPRVGASFVVSGDHDRMRWFGRGPHENYPDRSSSAMLGVWEGPLDRSPYLVPQEFGLRMDCRWFELVSSATGDVVRIEAIDGPLHLSATHHSPEALFAARTATDLSGERNEITICVDARHRGLGTASCGPDVLDRYRIEPGRIEFAYRISAGRVG